MSRVRRRGGALLDSPASSQAKSLAENATFSQANIIAGAVGVFALGISVSIIIMLTVHTDVWSTLSQNHLDDDELDQITGDTLEVNSLVPIDGGDGTIVFGSEVLFEGDLIINQTTSRITSDVEADIVDIVTDIFIPDEDNPGEYTSLTRTIVGIQDNCSIPALNTLLDDATLFRDTIVSESTTIFTCLESSNQTLSELQVNNTIRTTNHTLRLDDLETNSCATIVAQAINQTNQLNNLAPNISSVNMTIINTDTDIETISDVLDQIASSIPLLQNSSCVVNETLFNETRSTVLDLRVLINSTADLFDVAGNYSIECSATLVSIETALDLYNSTIQTNQAIVDGFNQTYLQYFNNVTTLSGQHTLLQIVVSNNNATLTAFQAEYDTSVLEQTDFETRLIEQWMRYNALNTQLSTQQSTFDSLETLFNQTYTQFNATEGLCDTGVDTYNALINASTTLITQYQTDYSTYLDLITTAQGLPTNISSFESLVLILDNNVTVYSTIVGSWESDLDLINATLIEINGDLANITAFHDSINATLIQSNALLVTLEGLVVTLNDTVNTLASLVANQTTQIADHDTRLTTLEGFTCPSTTLFNQVAEVHVAAENLTVGDVVVLDRNGQAVKATNLYPKGAYQLDPQSVGVDEITTTFHVPIDTSDHFYSCYRLAIGSNLTLTFGDVSFDQTNTAFVKFSPVHEVLWTAYTQYTSTSPANAGPRFTSMIHEPVSNTIMAIGSYDGDDEDSQVDFYNADGQFSGFTTPRFSPSGATGERVGCIYAQLSATGEWLNVAMTEHYGANVECYQLAGGLAYNGRIGIAGTASSAELVTSGVITFPGGINITVNAAQDVAYWGLFDLSTFQFDYIKELQPQPGDDCGVEVSSFSRDSGNSAYVVGIWKDTDNAVAQSLTFDGFYTPNVTVTEIDHKTVGASSALLVWKIDLDTGSTLWARTSNMTVDNLFYYGPDGDTSFGPIRRLSPDADVDHYDRLYISFVAKEENVNNTMVFAYDGTSVPSGPLDAYAAIVMKINPRAGDLIDMAYYPYRVVGGVIENERIQAAGMVATPIGDMFVAFRFNGENFIIDGTNYTSTGQASSVVIKYASTALIPEYVYFDDYSEMSYTLDSHGNIWSFLHENALQAGDSQTLDVASGIGIVKLGQADLEPYGVVQYDASVGEETRIVLMGTLTYPSNHGFSPGVNVFNDHGVLTKDNTYGKTRVAITYSADTIIVSIHRPRITPSLI